MFRQLSNFLTENNCVDTFQSGFWSNHSIETALVQILNDINLTIDSGKVSVLVLLDLTAAFDTVDPNILIKRLKNWVGLSM